MSLFNTLLGGKQGWRLGGYERRLKQINRLESTLSALSDEGVKDRVAALRSQAEAGHSLDDLLVEAFALGRDNSRRANGGPEQEAMKYSPSTQTPCRPDRAVGVTRRKPWNDGC